MKKACSLSRSENMTFRALYLIAIVLVVDGHTTLDDMFSMGDLFRYYSFHLLLFAFGAGYFFTSRGSILSDLAVRTKRLLVPLYIWNAVYGVGAALLRRFGGFEIGESLSLYTLLIAPITDGEHFVWNLGSWFLFPLFLSQTIYSLIRRCAKIWKDNEWITFALCLSLGCAAAQICHMNRQDLLPQEIAHHTQERLVFDANNPHLSVVQGGNHHGSHPHMVNEFVRSIVENRKPMIDAVTAANWTAAGICAHESAMQGGAAVQIPAFD